MNKKDIENYLLFHPIDGVKNWLYQDIPYKTIDSKLFAHYLKFKNIDVNFITSSMFHEEELYKVCINDEYIYVLSVDYSPVDYS